MKALVVNCKLIGIILSVAFMNVNLETKIYKIISITFSHNFVFYLYFFDFRVKVRLVFVGDIVHVEVCLACAVSVKY